MANDPILVGLATFLLLAALGACCFVIATGVARFICPPPRETYGARLVIMFLIVILWWACTPIAAGAYIGNRADPRDVERHARWEAKQSATLYGSHTIWAWCLVALLGVPKTKPREP